LSQIALLRVSSADRNLEGLTKVILVVPLEADLEVVVLSDHAEEFSKEVRALTLREAVNVLDVMAEGKDGLPSSDWVGANDWMLGGELGTNIQWRSTGRIIEFKFVVLGGLGEEWLSISCSKSVKELLVGWGEAVIDFISRGPECICMIC
jgi:hypothetical protein